MLGTDEVTPPVLGVSPVTLMTKGAGACPEKGMEVRRDVEHQERLRELWGLILKKKSLRGNLLALP